MFEGLFRPMHLLVILVIVLIVFGPGKLPEVGKSLGKAVRELKASVHGEETIQKDGPEEEEPKNKA